MIKKSKFNKKWKVVLWVVGFFFCEKSANSQTVVPPAKTISESIEKTYIEHGWSKLDTVVNRTPYQISLFSSPQKLINNLPDGTVIRIKALKTGFGNYYCARKQVKSGIWELRADAKDAKDPASQFLIMRVGDNISLTCEVADGLLLASDPKTFGVILVSDKETGDNVLWELVEDARAGATLESCYLKNKATKGVLTASFESSETAVSEIADLQNKISSLEKEFPYLQITYAKSAGTFNSYSTAGSRDIKDVLNSKISNGMLKRTGDWVTQDSGTSAVAAGWPAGRDVKIKFIVNGDKANEITIETKEKKDLILSPNQGPYAQMLSQAYAKHPAAEFKKKLEMLSNRQKTFSGLKQSDIGRTGYEGNVFEPNQWSKIAIETVVELAEDDETEAPIIIEASPTQDGVISKDVKLGIQLSPEFRGFGKEIVQDYGPGKIISIDPLNSDGFVWFDQKLQSAWMGTIVFRALAKEGDVQICFSDAVAPRTAYRVVFGAAENTKTVIYKNDKPIQEISAEQNEDARITPGMVERFWVSLNNGTMIIGKGDPGTHIIMAYQDYTPADNIKLFGFSTGKSNIKYTDVQLINSPIVVVAPKASYIKDTKSIQLGTIQSPAWSSLPLSPSDAGTVVFQASGSEDATLILANDKNEGYAISFGSDGNKFTKIMQLQDNVELCKIDTAFVPLAKLDAGKPNKFWVSFYRGFMILGNGDVGKNSFCMYIDSDAPTGVSKIGFAGKSAIQNLEIWPTLALSFDQDVSKYIKQKQIAIIQGRVDIIVPFNYRIIQKGPSVVFRDNITGMTMPVAGTPDPGLDYHFKLDIASNGLPSLIAGQNAKTPEKIALEVSVKVVETAKDLAFSLSQQMAYGTGPEFFSSVAAIAGSAAAGAVGATLAAAQSAIQSKIDEMQVLANRQVYIERVESAAKGTSTVSEEAKKDRQGFDDKIKAIFSALPKAIAKLDPPMQIDYTTKLWSDALRLITDAYVLEDQGTKKSVISGLSDLYNSVKSLGLSDASFPTYTRMIDILIMAYKNVYLTDTGDLIGEQNRNNWYLWINNLAKEIFNSEFIKKGIDINFKGEYIWFPVPLPTPGQGSVVFEVKAYSDIFICFSENAVQQSDMLEKVYEVVIGMNQNKYTVIHRKFLGDSIVEFDHKKISDLSPEPMDFKKYWINVDNGIISGGIGDLGTNKLWEYKDPYPATLVKWVGLSNWNTINTFRNIKIGNSVSKNSQTVPSPVAVAVPKVTLVPKKPALPAKIAKPQKAAAKQVAKSVTIKAQ
jgi:hypothetical protein